MSAVIPMATSTPYRSGEKQEVLKESKESNKNEPARTIHKISKGNSPVSSTSKENVRVRQLKRSSHPAKISNEKTSKKEEDKRLTAIAAMKIQESRRQRMMSQEDDDDGEKTEVNLWKEKDSLAEKKRLEAKTAKEKRILAFLAEQEARKKKEAEAALKAVPSDVQPTIQAPRQHKSLIPKFRSKVNCSFKPKFQLFGPHIVQFSSKESPAPVAPVCIPTLKSLTNIQPQQCCSIIRYSKDDLRALNPYGYYFM